MSAPGSHAAALIALAASLPAAAYGQAPRTLESASPPPAAVPAPPAAAPAPPTATPAPPTAAPAPPTAAPAPPTAAPAPPTAAPAPPTAAPAPLPASPLAPTRVATSPDEAIVHVAVNYREAWLETRSYVDNTPFVRACATPCDIRLLVDGLEARVTAPGMTTSNTFRFDAGSGRASVRVDGGSAAARTAGIVSLAAGIPLALVGMALLAQGKLNDQTGLQAAGITALALGGTGIVVSLPLLLKGSTHVKDSRGTRIARAAADDPAH